MKRIGIVGGIGPEASLYYYRLLIELSRRTQSSGRKYPEIEMLIYNLNQNECINMFDSGRWVECTAKLVNAIQGLYRGGADFALIACNTAHVVFDDVKAKSPIPLLSIVEEACKAVEKLRLAKVGLFGSRITMQGHFYQDVFRKNNISIVVPREEEQVYIHSKNREEIVLGILRDETRAGFLEIARRMIEEESIQGLIIACTEMPLLLTKDELGIPFFDTSKIHAQSAFRYSLSET